MIIYFKNDDTGGYGKGGGAIKILKMGGCLKLSYYYDYLRSDNLEIIVKEFLHENISGGVRASSREN
jgi:hypothetical protein